jgi:hypothetical protein
MMFKTAES